MGNKLLLLVSTFFYLSGAAAYAQQCSDFYDPNAGHGDIDKNAVNLKGDKVYSSVNFQLTSQYVLDRQHLPISPGSYDDLTYYNGQPYRPSDAANIEAQAKKSGGVYCKPYGISSNLQGPASASDQSKQTFYPSLAFYNDKNDRAVAMNDFTKKNCITETSAMFQIGGDVNSSGFQCYTGGPKQTISPEDIQKAFGKAIKVNGVKSNAVAHLADSLRNLSAVPYIGGAASISSSILRHFTSDTGSSGSGGNSFAGNANQ